MKMRALIIDDESPARKELRFLLQAFDDVQVVGEAENALEAMELIENVPYTVIFLDINMPGINGLELAKKLMDKENAPAVIFTTAYEEYAFQAFNVHAYDYLLKPINPKRLEEAIQTVRKRKKINCPAPTKATQQEEDADLRPLEVIPAEQNTKTILIRPEEIVYISTDKDNVIIKTETETYLTRFTLKELEARLDPKMFFRTHRCYLVNLRKMRELIPYFSGTYTAVVQDKERTEVPVSRTQARKLKDILGIK